MVEATSSSHGLESSILSNADESTYIQSLLPGSKFTLLYSGNRDGWSWDDFHKRCDNKGPTVTLCKSSKGKIAGAYTAHSWESPFDHKRGFDSSAFTFSLAPCAQYPIRGDLFQALFLYDCAGPQFYGALQIGDTQPMNGENSSRCLIGEDPGYSYWIPSDEEGNSILTGDGGKNNGSKFTCVELEVFQVTK